MNSEPIPIFIIVEDGRVTDVKNVPDGRIVQVIDKDVDFVSSEEWRVSPVDGEACTIQTFQPV